MQAPPSRVKFPFRTVMVRSSTHSKQAIVGESGVPHDPLTHAADASAFPVLTSVDPVVTILMMAERAAAWMRAGDSGRQHADALAARGKTKGKTKRDETSVVRRCE